MKTLPLFGQVMPCGRAGMKKPIVAVRNLATPPTSWVDVHNASSSLDFLWASLPFRAALCWIVTVDFIPVTVHEIFALCHVYLRRSLSRDDATQFISPIPKCRRSQWSRVLRRRSTAAGLLRSWVRIPLRYVCLLCVLSGRDLCDELITRQEEPYRLWRVVVCDQEPRWRGGHSPRWDAEPETIK
jgi:hypothetical protein